MDKNKASRQAYVVLIQACECSVLNFIPGSGNVPKVSKHTLDEPPLHSQLASIRLPNVPTALCLDDPVLPAPDTLCTQPFPHTKKLWHFWFQSQIGSKFS